MHTHRKKSTHVSTVLYIFMFICLNIFHISVLCQTAKSSLLSGHLQADLHTHKVMTKPHFCSGKLTIKLHEQANRKQTKTTKIPGLLQKNLFSQKAHEKK